MFLILGLIFVLYLMIWVFAGIIAIGLTVLGILGFVVWVIIKEMDKRRVRYVSRAELLREMYDLMIDDRLIQEIEEGVGSRLGYRKNYNETRVKYGTMGREDLKEVFSRLKRFWELKGISLELEDNTEVLLGGYVLVFKEYEQTSIQRERNIRLLVEEELNLEEIAERDWIVQGEVVRIVNQLKGDEEEIKNKIVDEGEVEYRIDQGGLGQIEERNMVELIKYAESWMEKGVGVDIVIEEDEQKVKFYVDSSRES